MNKAKIDLKYLKDTYNNCEIHRNTIALIEKGDSYCYETSIVKDEVKGIGLYSEAFSTLHTFDGRCASITPYVSLRLAECHLKGIGTEISFVDAFYFILKARHFLRFLPYQEKICNLPNDPNQKELESCANKLLREVIGKFKNLGFVICLEDNGARIFSKFRLPFQTNVQKHPEYIDLKDAVEQILKFLPRLSQTTTFHARYGTTDDKKAFYDLENVLLYNFGFPKDLFVARLYDGITFSRIDINELKKFQAEENIPKEFCHCYEYFADSNPTVASQRERLIAQWNSQPFVTIESSKGVSHYWKAMRQIADKIEINDIIDTTVKNRLTLYLEIEKPKAKELYLLGSLKPLLDGIISAFHSGDFDTQEIQLFSEKLDVPKEWITNTAFNVLGMRKYVQQYPSKTGIKWNPADDLCDKVSISIVEGEEWRISGRIYEIVPCCPKCSKSRVSKILYGMPAYNEELQKEIDNCRIVLAGCMIENNAPQYICRWCKTKF